MLHQTSLFGDLSALCLVDGCRKIIGHSGKHEKYPNLLEGLPEGIQKKINKTAQTRGAQPYERVPYQNRVNRSNRAVVPFKFRHVRPAEGYQNGYTIMVRPEEYFDRSTKNKREDFPEDVVIGDNAFIFYSTRNEWRNYPPLDDWIPCQYENNNIDNGNGSESLVRKIKRIVGGKDVGHYIARVPATTASKDGEAIVKGPPQGIRFFEYASDEMCWLVKCQLAFLAWQVVDIGEVTSQPMPENLRLVMEHCELLDWEKFHQMFVVNKDRVTCCPLCQDTIKARELMETMEQIAGREIADLTVTDANLFHLEPLIPGSFNHAIYKLGWGHHHCNTVARDRGMKETLDWMETVLIRTGRIRKTEQGVFVIVGDTEALQREEREHPAL